MLPLFFAAIALVNAQSPASTSLEPLASKHFTWPDIPYQVSGDNAGPRGPQFGINLCNSTTQNQNSTCQTMFVNSALDFCMWSSPTPDNTIGDSESYEVAWCSKEGHGTRVIPPGTITGLQFLYAKSYVQVVGYLNQVNVNIQASDEGGELDPHGDDEQGNPLGGIVFTNAYPMSADTFDQMITSNSAPSTNYTQVEEWVDFIGSGFFCLKMCNPDNAQAPNICAHVYDEIGCFYNAPADYAAINNSFLVCDSDDMTPPGVFTTDGTTTTWFQPLNGPLGQIPYTASIPASSNCHTYSSEQLFATATSTSSSSGTSSTPTGSSSGVSSSRSGAGASQTSASSSTGGSSAAPPPSSSPLIAITIMMVCSLLGPFLL